MGGPTVVNPYRDPISLIRSGSGGPCIPRKYAACTNTFSRPEGRIKPITRTGSPVRLAKLCGTPRGSLVMRFGTALASALDPSCESFDEPARALRFGHLFGVPLHSQEQQIRSLEGFDAPVTADGGTV